MTGQSSAASGETLCMLAKRVPRITKTGDREMDTKLEEQRAALVGIVQYLHQKPEFCVPTYLKLAQGKIDLCGLERPEWSDSYNCLQKIPKYFKAQLLIADSGNSLTQDDMNRINSKDQNAIPMLFELATQMGDSFAIPTDILNKDWSGKVFLSRMAHCGHRIRRLKPHGLADDGSIDWTRFASYVLEWNEEDIATNVRHISGTRKPVPEDVTISKKFEIHFPAQCTNCRLTYGTISISLADLFLVGEGPHVHNVKKCKDAQTTVLKDISKQLAETPAAHHPTAVAPDPRFLKVSEQEAQEVKKAAAKARMAARGPARKRQKLVALS